jgi:UDP:flavonoid glycosyltransferase YjiC (YdhE family)
LNAKRILVAVLNWGLGHATRSIPVIKALIERNFVPVIASDGTAGKLLQNTFPDHEYIELPHFKVVYPENKSFFTLAITKQLPFWYKQYHRELKLTDEIIHKYRIDGLISDNRPGI